MPKFLCTSMLALASIASFAQTNNLNLPVRVQEHSQWCWDASSQMLANYMGKNPTQCSIANYIFGISHACSNPYEFDWNDQANSPGTEEQMGQALSALEIRNGITKALYYTTVQKKIDAGRPFIMCWAWTQGGGHALVGKGYGNTGIYINDPWPGNGAKWQSYSSCRRAADHKWVVTVYLYYKQ